MSEQKTLEYRPGRPLTNLTTDGRSPAAVAKGLQHSVTKVILEPGDATRYDLLLVLHDSELTVVRTVGGRAVGAVTLEPMHPVGTWDLDGIAEDNRWTAELLAWWLTQLTEALQQNPDSALP